MNQPRRVRRPVMLVILDGWGLREDGIDNAVRCARTPAFDGLMRDWPHATLLTSGLDVGLPDGQMGNSEVGHLNIGAGRIVMQELPRITQSIKDGSLAKASALSAAVASLHQSGGTCHLLGLVSPGGVHAHQDHALALASILTNAGIDVKVHAITDGRDTPPRSGAENLLRLSAALPARAALATVCGRFFAMDRDNRWDRVSRAYATLVDAAGRRDPNADSALHQAYAANVTDEFIEPTVIGDYIGMKDGDGLVCFNFRADRAREILTALLDPEFSNFPRPRRPMFAAAVGMVSYSADLDRFLNALFPPQDLSNVLGEVVAQAGRAQLRMAESEKYPHVTYFLNGGREEAYAREDRLMVPSPKVATYDLQPEMSAAELTDKALAAISSSKYDLIILNYANPDMVGHTGNLEAAIKAVETVDQCLGRVAEGLKTVGGALLVTADHGNCEQMQDLNNGGPYTAHTLNPVPMLLVGLDGVSLRQGRLADVAPTLLEMMQIRQPPEMTGSSLFNDK